MALSAANLELGVTGLKPVSVAVTAASFAPASPLGWPSSGAADISRHKHCLQTFVPMGWWGWRLGRERMQHRDLTPLAKGMEDTAIIWCSSSSHFVTEVFPL